MRAAIDVGMVYRIAEEIAKRLLALLKAGRLQRVDIDVIRAACEIAASYHCLSAQELEALEERTLRRFVEKVG